MIQIMESDLLKTGHLSHFVQVPLNDIQYEDICKAINSDLSATRLFF